MYCSQCGALNEATAHFCKNCGAALLVKEATETTDILYAPPPQEINPFSTLMFWGAVAIVIGFFLPWVSLGGIISLNGWSITNGLLQAGSYTRKAGHDTTFYSIMLYLMPIASIAVIIGLFANAGKIFLRIVKLIPVVMVLALIGILFSNSKGRFEEDAFRYFSFGFYLTIIATFLLAFAPVKK